MPDVFEKYFNDFGKSVSDFIIEKIRSSLQSLFWKNDYIEIEDSLEKISETFEKLKKALQKSLKFMAEAKLIILLLWKR